MFDETCSVCGNQRFWWRSRSGYLVCMRCHPDPFDALETLARRGKPGLVQQVQAWALRSNLAQPDL
jgi:hypothetical protein